MERRAFIADGRQQGAPGQTDLTVNTSFHEARAEMRHQKTTHHRANRAISKKEVALQNSGICGSKMEERK
jgi:hypothetical protein